jgi:hypothetical protein
MLIPGVLCVFSDTKEEQDLRMDHEEARELFTSPGVVSQQVFQPGRTLVVPN